MDIQSQFAQWMDVKVPKNMHEIYWSLSDKLVSIDELLRYFCRKLPTGYRVQSSETKWSNVVLYVAGFQATKLGWYCGFWHFEGGCRELPKTEKLETGPVITNHSFLVPKLLLYLSKLGNSFRNKIKINKIQGRKRVAERHLAYFLGRAKRENLVRNYR